MRVMDNKAYALMAILVASVASIALIGPASAQQLTVETDKDSYSAGETITVSGNVGTVQEGQPLLIQIFNPNGAAYRFDQVTVAANGDYEYQFRVGGNLGISGTYRVVVSYAGQQSAETTFEFTGGEAPPTGFRTISVEIDGEEYPIRYQITGGTLTGVEADVQNTMLIFSIDATEDGQLVVELPRDVIDATTAEGEDDVFIVTADEFAEELIFEEESDDEVRTLTIDFGAGTETIEIQGTFLVPEFGAIAAIVLAVAIVGIIVATTRYSGKFSFLPRH